MKRTLIDLICSNKECGEVSLNKFWPEDTLDYIRRGQIVCDKCLEPLIITSKVFNNEDK